MQRRSIALPRRQLQLRALTFEPVIEELAEGRQRPVHRVARTHLTNERVECSLGFTLGAEPLTQDLLAFPGPRVEPRVDSERISAVPLEDRAPRHGQTIVSVHFSCTFATGRPIRTEPQVIYHQFNGARDGT